MANKTETEMTCETLIAMLSKFPKDAPIMLAVRDDKGMLLCGKPNSVALNGPFVDIAEI